MSANATERGPWWAPLGVGQSFSPSGGSVMRPVFHSVSNATMTSVSVRPSVSAFALASDLSGSRMRTGKFGVPRDMSARHVAVGVDALPAGVEDGQAGAASVAGVVGHGLALGEAAEDLDWSNRPLVQQASLFDGEAAS